MAKFIFLDFDGVMDTFRYSNRLYYEGKPENDRFGTVFDPDCIKALEKIIDATGAEIVISSSWKVLMSYGQILEMWKERNLPGFVTDATPTCSSRRGEEIAAWLDIFTKNSGGEEYDYVILDDLDEDNFNKDQIPHLIRIDDYEGLTDDATLKAIEMLGNRILTASEGSL